MKTIVKVLLGLFILGWVWYSIFMQSITPPSISGDAYIKLEINGRIAAIHSYDRGQPVVTINQKRITLAVPGLAWKYLQVNDSLAKRPNETLVKSYRFYQDSIETIVWGYKADGYQEDDTGMISSSKQRKH